MSVKYMFPIPYSKGSLVVEVDRKIYTQHTGAPQSTKFKIKIWIILQKRGGFNKGYRKKFQRKADNKKGVSLAGII